MAKRTKIISLSVKPDHHVLLRKKATEQNMFMSELARQIIEDFVELRPDIEKKLKVAAKTRQVTIAQLIEQLVERFPIDDDTIKPIILKVPVSLLNNKEQLRSWLEDRSQALISHLFVK